MGSGKTSSRRKQAIEGMVTAASAAVANNANFLSTWMNPMGYALTSALVNCSQIIARWMFGRISGSEAFKELCNEGGGLLGSLLGASIGCIIGTIIFPGIGSAIGAAIGGIVGYKAGKYLASKSML
ncbi:unnamed protein product [Blepharisma stoltei]|uniref:Glycine zipper domain-containing protein n=1 Tax=Blepharisma stoltei TaxID=1481888 RepID=A0AAU9IQJ0_9CILI|nr:unnamed protein product [Blepharisma stoltei]